MDVLIAQPVVGLRVAEPCRVVVPAASEGLPAVQTSLYDRPASTVDLVALTVYARRTTVLRQAGTNDVDAVIGRWTGYSFRAFCIISIIIISSGIRSGQVLYSC